MDNKEFSEGLEKRTRKFAVRIAEADLIKWERIKPEYNESSELLAIFTSIGSTGKSKNT